MRARKPNRGPLITIDGPAASGKSTVAKRIALENGMQLIDSGSMYRAVALLSVERCIDPLDSRSLEEIACEVRNSFSASLDGAGSLRVFLGVRDVTEEIRSNLVGKVVSPVSAHGTVRRQMLMLQREMVGERGAVAEGRDMGTTVFPDAELKVYLDASEDERVRRRFEEFRSRGIEVSVDEVRDEIRLRDKINSSREESPLRAAPDAVMIDTTSMSVDEVVEEICRLLPGGRVM